MVLLGMASQICIFLNWDLKIFYDEILVKYSSLYISGIDIEYEGETIQVSNSLN